MELGKWVTNAINSTSGNETTEATLYLLFFGSLVPVMKISSNGTLQVKKNSTWQNVVTEDVLTSALSGVLAVDQ